LWEQRSEDVVSRGPVDLHNPVEAWKIGGPRQSNICHSRNEFLLGDMDRRVFLLCILNDLSDRELRRYTGSNHGLGLSKGHSGRADYEEAADTDSSNPAKVSNE
jgi:hypothetical protein